jgi:hypothetical protein
MYCQDSPCSYPQIYHVIRADSTPIFIPHGIIRFDKEIACFGYNIIGIKIKIVPTTKNDKIDRRGNVPDLNSYIIRLIIMRKKKPAIQ